MTDEARTAEVQTKVMAKDVHVEVTLKITHEVKIRVRTQTDKPMTVVADAALEQYLSSGGRKWASSFSSNLAITPADSRAEIESFRTIKVEPW